MTTKKVVPKHKLQRLTNKTVAQRLWAQEVTIYLVPCKMKFNSFWCNPCPVNINDNYYKDDANRFEQDWKEVEELGECASYHAKQYAHMWDGTLEETTWNLMYNDWKWYNTSPELGHYAHYYVSDEDYNEHILGAR